MSLLRRHQPTVKPRARLIRMDQFAPRVDEYSGRLTFHQPYSRRFAEAPLTRRVETRRSETR